MKRFLSIRQLPRVIDPVGPNVLEVDAVVAAGATYRAAAQATHKPWRFFRIPAAESHTQLTLPEGVVHVFGSHQNLAECLTLLAYDAGGGLTHLLVRNDADWEVYPFSEEITGARINRPSCRIVFTNAETCDAFVVLMQQLRAGGPVSPHDLRDCLDHVVDIHAVEVAT